jgi:hypothetical protein
VIFSSLEWRFTIIKIQLGNGGGDIQTLLVHDNKPKGLIIVVLLLLGWFIVLVKPNYVCFISKIPLAIKKSI